MSALQQQGCGAGFFGHRHGVSFPRGRYASAVRPWLRGGVLLMPNTLNIAAVQVFAAPAASCGPGITWEAATTFLRKRLHQRFGEAVAVEYIEMFSPRSFEFPDVLEALQRGGSLPVVRVGERIVSMGEKLSENRIASEISGLLQSDRRNG